MKTDDAGTQVSVQNGTGQQTSSLRSIKQLYGDTLHALNGETGRVKDFYFDDQNWVIRHVIVEAGAWLSGRLVLLAPHALTHFEEDGVSRPVNLTRQQSH